MSTKDLLLALVVVLAWGFNFVIIKVGLHGVPPLLLGALRCFFAAFPAVFFVRRPDIPWGWLVLYGLVIFFGQFAFLFVGVHAGMSAGLASVVSQTQAFFTLGFAALFLRERSFHAHNLAGLLLAALGLVLIGTQATAGGGARAMTLAGFALTLGGAVMWALGNIITKKIGQGSAVGLVVWGSMAPTLAFLAMSCLVDGPRRVGSALAGIGMASAFAGLYLGIVATLLGYGIWSHLLARYPAGQVAPFSLLVPIIGLSSAAALLGERFTPLEIAGAALIVCGLFLNVFGGRLRRRLTAAR